MHRVTRLILIPSLLVASVGLAGCAGGLATGRMDMGEVDGIVRAPLTPRDGPAFAKVDGERALAKSRAE